MDLFVVLLVTLIVVVAIFVILFANSDPFYPFRRMDKDDIDDCYGTTRKPKKK